MKFVRLALLAIGVAFGVLGYHLLTADLHSPWWQAVPSVAIAWAFLVAGLIAWWRRPQSRVGLLMIAVAFGLLVRKLQYADSSSLFTVGFAFSELFAAFLVHTVLAYPSGRLGSRLERRFVSVVYAAVLTFPLATLLVYDRSQSCLFDCSAANRPRPRSLLLVGGDDLAFQVLRDAYRAAVYGLFALIFIGLIVRRLVLATPRARRMLAPLLVAGVAAGLRAISEAVFTFIARTKLAGLLLFGFEEAVQVAVPIALLVGLLRARLARALVADLVRELERTPPAGVRDALARTLRDPSLEVAFWVPERKAYVDAAGKLVELPLDGPTRAVTPLAHDGQPIAALIHDPGLRDEPGLVEAAGAAARLALENARLQAEVRAQLAKVREASARTVAATDAERRRIERDLHDGAQQRLVALALDLRVAQRALGESVDPSVEQLLASAVEELQLAIEELRELAHGIHPAILTEEGLAAALESLAARTPLRVTVAAAPSERVAAEIEAAAYFVACEAVTNSVKHAHATEVTISAVKENGTLVIAVADDGVGGANAADGSGLRGLADRLEAYGGSLRVESPPGGGTHVIGEIPCGS